MDATQSRRRRGSITKQEIIDAALNLLDQKGPSALTFNLLGQELKASSTAVYRHFASRDDVILGVADHLDKLSLSNYSPSNEWKVDLRDLGWRAWRVAEQHPAAASICLGLVTNGVNELRAVECVLNALFLAGLEDEDAVLHYQVYSNLVLSAAMSHGIRLASEKAVGTRVQDYHPEDPSQFPYAERVKKELRVIDHEEVFAKLMEMFIDSVAASVEK